MSIGRLKRELDQLLQLTPDARRPVLRSLQQEDADLHSHLLAALRAAEDQTTFLRPTLSRTHLPESGLGRPSEQIEGRVIAGRYEIGKEIGRGQSATVHLAVDQVLGRNVAVKVFHVDQEKAFDRVRREAAALRLLRLPGVVEIYDDARDGDLAVIVMDYVQGSPFPGHLASRTWDHLKERMVQLLQILARIHWAGVIHCDIKPSNVLVGTDGRLQILDLGISKSPLLQQGPRPRTRVAGTFAFMAPEIWEGVAPTAASDLYSVGILMQKAMAQNELMEGDRYRDVPGFVVDTLMPGLLAEDPQDRFESAADVLELLQPQESGRSQPTAETIGQLEPRQLFAGSDRLHWIPSDASAALVRECIDGDLGPLDVLRRWTRSGWGRWEGGRYVVTRAALEQLGQRRQIHRSAVAERGVELAQGLTEPVSADAVPTDALPGFGVVTIGARITCSYPRSDLEAEHEAYRLAERLLDQGHLDAALLHLEQGLSSARLRASMQVTPRACSLLLKWALATGTRQSVHRARFELQRFPDSDRLRPYESLARAALLALDGDPQGSLDLIDRIGTIDEPEGDLCVQSVRAFASRCSPDPEVHESAIRFLEAWAASSEHPDAAGAERDWAGWFAYFNGDYARAGSLQEQAGGLLVSPIRKLNACLNAATSYLEGERYTDARRLATSALDQARTLRHPHYAGRAEWVLRSTEYRTGIDQEPDLELIEAAAQLEVPHLYAQLCLNEAAFAWRSTDIEIATDLARRATQAFATAGDPAAAFLARSLLLSLLSDRSIPLLDLQTALAACPMPLLALQSLALLASAGIHAPWAKESALPLLSSLPAGFTARRELLSLAECRSFLD